MDTLVACFAYVFGIADAKQLEWLRKTQTHVTCHVQL
jgi:hypothetical protein